MSTTAATPNPTASALRDALRELGQTSPSAHDRRTRRVAVAVAVRGGPGRRPDDLTDEPVPIADCRLYTLSRRWCRRQDGSARPAAPFALLRPEVAGGRVRYAPTRVVDLADNPEARRLKGDDARAAALLIHAIADAAPADLADALHLPVPILNPVAPAGRAARRRQGNRGRGPRPQARPGRPSAGADRPQPRLRRPPTPSTHPRTARLPRLAHLPRARRRSATARRQRRPRPGLGPPRRHLPVRLLRRRDRARPLRRPPGRLPSAGIVVPAGDDGVDVLARLLDAPWERPAVPGAFVQVLALAAGPTPATMTFADAATTVDLLDLGAEGARFEPATPAAIREALGR